MSKDKYPSIFSPQMEAIVFIILQIFFATRANFKIGEYSRIFHSFSWGIFGHVTCLGQSRASEKIWWIIIRDSWWSHGGPCYSYHHRSCAVFGQSKRGLNPIYTILNPIYTPRKRNSMWINKFISYLNINCKNNVLVSNRNTIRKQFCILLTC